VTHDPMLDGITRWTAFESLGGLFQGMNKRPTGKYVLFSDLPALIAKVREDAVRDYAEAHYANKMQRSQERYEQGQRDEREKWEPMVQALTDELLAKAQPDASMGAQYLAGYAAALDAAREKIAALPCDAYEIKVSRMKVLAAVDALTDKTPSDEGRNTG
jgi:hypothetical protein